MKVYISEHLDKIIEGFNTIPIVYGSVDLGSIPNNGASVIVAIDALDSIKQENIADFIRGMASKMRINAVIHLGGLDAYALSKDLIGGKIDIEDYNKSITGKLGVYSSRYICDLIQSQNLTINSVTFRGNNYEISATRIINQN